MTARRDVGAARRRAARAALADAGSRVEAAKVGLGERGPMWCWMARRTSTGDGAHDALCGVVSVCRA